MRHLALGEAGVTASAKEMADAYHLPLPLLSKDPAKISARAACYSRSLEPMAAIV